MSYANHYDIDFGNETGLQHEFDSLQKKLSQLPAVDMQHAPAKLPSKLHLSAYVDLLAQSLCSMHSHCTSKLV